MAGRYQLKRSALVFGGITAFGIARISKYVDENFRRIPIHFTPIMKTQMPVRDATSTTSSVATSNTTLSTIAIQTVAALVSGAALSHNDTDVPADQTHATTKLDSDSDLMKYCVLVLTVVFTLWQAYSQRQRGKLYVCVTIALSLLQSVDLVPQTMFALFCCLRLVQLVAPASLDVAGHRKRIFAIAAEIMCRTVESTLGVERASPTPGPHESNVHSIVQARPEPAALPDVITTGQVQVIFDETPQFNQKHSDGRTTQLLMTSTALRWLKSMWRKQKTTADDHAMEIQRLLDQIAKDRKAHASERAQQDELLDAANKKLTLADERVAQLKNQIAAEQETVQQQALKTSDLTTADRERKEVNDELAEVKAELAMVQGKLYNQEQLSRTRGDQGDRLRQEIVVLKQQKIAQDRNHTANNMRQNNAIYEIRKEAEAKQASLKSDLQKQTKLVKELTKHKEDATKGKEILNSEKDFLTKEKEVLTKEKEVLIKEKEVLTKEKADLTKEKEDLTEERENLAGGKEELESELKELKQKLDKSEPVVAGDDLSSLSAGEDSSDAASVPSNGESPDAMPAAPDGQPSTSEAPRAARGQGRRPPRVGRPHPPRRRKGQHGQ